MLYSFPSLPYLEQHICPKPSRTFLKQENQGWNDREAQQSVCPAVVGLSTNHLGIDVISGNFLFQRTRQHHGADDRDEQQPARNFKRQSCVRVQIPANASSVVCDLTDAGCTGGKVLLLGLPSLGSLFQFRQVSLLQTLVAAVNCEQQP